VPPAHAAPLSPSDRVRSAETVTAGPILDAAAIEQMVDAKIAAIPPTTGWSDSSSHSGPSRVLARMRESDRSMWLSSSRPRSTAPADRSHRGDETGTRLGDQLLARCGECTGDRRAMNLISRGDLI